MLRARGLKDRGSTYVCAFCRHQLSSRTDIRRSQNALTQVASGASTASSGGHFTSPCGTRQLSTTSALWNSKDGGPQPGGFPRSFPGARPGGFGGFGMAKTSSPSQPAASDGLLPHERAARKTAPPTTAKPSAPGAAANAPNAGHAKDAKSKHRSHRPRKDKLNSSSVLADIFSGARTPRAPPTPKSWQTDGRTNKGHAKRNEPAASQGAEADTAAQKTSEKASQPWGAFRQRRVTTVTEPAEQKDMEGFWDQLEERAKKSAQKVSNMRARDAPEPVVVPAVEEKTPSQDTGERSRRSSRFEMADEEPNDRRGKKSKQRQKNRGQSRYGDEDSWDNAASERWERAQQRKADKQAHQAKLAAMEARGPTPIFLPEFINISNLAQALKQPQASFLSDLEEMGFENITSDTIMTGETAALVAAEYNFEPTVDTGSQRDLRPRPPPEDPSVLPQRPPVVTIMGHVDHGKTTLLDWLRKSSVAAQEHGGITQHIGAFVVNMSSGKSITFLDTPGHAAFLSMRQRGANVTDIVVLVVAADDSVMPQTLEALKHARSSKVPIIVAINKIDKEDARINEVKADLARHGVEIEDYGGDVQVVCVSGKTGQGMQDLEENIVTLSEVLDVRAETDGMAEGWVLESSVKQDGRTATVLVKRGTLRPGDFIVAGKTWARIRLLRNEAGKELDEAPPGTPVEIIGWRELPTAGDQILQSPDENKAKTAVEYRQEMAEREETSQQLAQQEQRQREKAAAEAAAKEAEAEGRELEDDAAPTTIYQNFTVKADVVGSMEAICGSITEIGNHEVQAKILRSSVGQISEYDIDHAAASNSIIVNFNSPIQPHIKQLAEAAKVKIFDHTVIYHVVDDVKSALSDLLPMNVSQRVVGEAQILQIFSINIKKKQFKNIAGCRVRNGTVRRTSQVRVLRRGKVIFEGKVDTLKHLKKDIQETGKGSECGIGLEGFEDFEVDDEIQAVEEVKEKRTL